MEQPIQHRGRFLGVVGTLQDSRADRKVVMLGAARSAATVDGILAAVVEFVRFGASRDWCAPAVAGRLSSRTELRFIPPGMERGERTDTPVVQRRAVRRRRVERPPATLTAGQVGAVVDACANLRDRFVVAALYATGLRIGEVLGLRICDLVMGRGGTPYVEVARAPTTPTARG